MATVLMPLPATDFDPTESGVPWATLTKAGHRVVFATPEGQPGRADDRMLDGQGLGPWKPLLRADANGRAAYAAMADSAEFRAPLRWDRVRAEAVDALLLPGGHAPGMKPYLESIVLQGLVVDAFDAKKRIGAICHGVLLAARSCRLDGRSVLHGLRTTALTKAMEHTAWLMTVAWLGDYYCTYPVTVQDEVTAALEGPEDFETGPLPLRRDDPGHLERGFTVRDGRYLSARWPGDAHRFAREFERMLRSG
jgi:protease I